MWEFTIVRALGELRAQHEKDGPLYKPSVTVNELDHAVVHSFPGLQQIRNCQHQMGDKHYKSILQEKAPLKQDSSVTSNLGGRPSLVPAADVIAFAKEILDENTKESERVVIVGRGSKRKMVIAKHLTQTKYRIWCSNKKLRQRISWTTFRRMLRIHFPHVRNPRRNTDVCSHCKTYRTVVLPTAKKCVQKIREALCRVCPMYFQAFDNKAHTLEDDGEFFEIFRAFIHPREQTAARDDMRKDLSRTVRLRLHSLEAEALRRLTPQVELVQAYEWHQVSARRQSLFLKSMRDGALPRSTALVQVDFKENVKYPMSPDETGDEWHAQSKLSLTVFGANALVPKPLGPIIWS